MLLHRTSSSPEVDNFYQMAFIHKQRAVIHHRFVVVKQLHLYWACPWPTHSPTVEEAGTRGEVAQSGAAVIFEDGDGSSRSLKVHLDVLTQAVDGGGVCDLHRKVAWVELEVFEWGQSELQLEKPVTK